MSPAVEVMPVDELKIFRNDVSSLPPQPVKDLLDAGVCVRCIFRLFCLQETIFSCASLSSRVLRETLYELADKYGGDGINNINLRSHKDFDKMGCVEELEQFKVCGVCLGILQFAYRDEKRRILINEACAHDFAAALGNYVKEEGHKFDGLSLEVSVPQLVVENEKAVRLFMKDKYSSESWFMDKLTHESISVKDFLKKTLNSPLENLLGVKSGESSFRLRLIYTLSDASSRKQQSTDNNGCHKKRKKDVDTILRKCDDLTKNNRCEVPQNSLVVSENDGTIIPSFSLNEVHDCCSLTFSCYRTPICVGGRYLKYSRNVSQTRWVIDDERMGEASVEEIVGGNILPIFKADSYKFHAAGREDIDVRMLGSGRPFLVEIQNAREFPSSEKLNEIQLKINSMENKLVRVKNLEILDNHGWDLMREGEAEKQKQYCALVWISRPITDDDEQNLSSLKDMQILQKTPIRVLHRRSPLDREKTIHWMRVERVDTTSQYFLLHLCTQAGTYIKEFVHGDLGRTHPSLGWILGCRAEILQLDVTDVKMNCFQR